MCEYERKLVNVRQIDKYSMKFYAIKCMYICECDCAFVCGGGKRKEYREIER